MPYTRSQRYNNHKNDFCKVIKPYLDKFECSNKEDKIIIMTDMFNLLIQEKWFLNKNSFVFSNPIDINAVAYASASIQFEAITVALTIE